MSKEIEIYANGIVHCSVCVPRGMKRSQIKREVNMQNPSGTSGGWEISKDKFEDGSPNPTHCDKHSTDRMHYLMVC